MECEFASINTNDDEKLKDIFNKTKTIAIVGLSPNEEKASHIVAKYLQTVGFKIVPIYPKEDEILGEKVYRSLAEIPFKIDMVDIFRKPQVISLVVDEVLKRGDVDTVWTQLGLVNNEAAQKAQENGLNVVQNKCTKIEYKRLFS
ncbi:MAG: CoA-binding protein [Arcobacter sp.]|nr:CoA-binding protein [Arcobacter sp.]